MCVSPAVGIDLGTTNSAIAVIEDGTPVCLPVDDKGHTTLPSAIHIAEDGSIIVGREAKKMLSSDPSNTFVSVKRIIGKKFKTVDKEKAFPFHVASDEDGLACLPCARIEGGRLYPEEVSAAVVQELLVAAEAATGAKPTRAIISVPAYFNEDQKDRTKAAGTLAGLEKIKMIREPVSAALAYGIDVQEDKTVLVFDLGGGTLDVSVLEVGGGTIEVLSTGGDARLGGDDFDWALVQYIGLKALDPAGIIHWREDRDLQAKLKTVAERAKIQLSDVPRVALRLPLGPGGAPIEIVITREGFEGAVADLYRRMRLPLDQACWQAGIELGAPVVASKDGTRKNKRPDPNASTKRLTPRRDFDFKSMRRQPISEILLVGGATRMPGVARFLKNMTGLEPREYLIDPDEAVALGAAVQAGMIDGSMGDLVVMDIWQAGLMRAFADKALKDQRKAAAAEAGGDTAPSADPEGGDSEESANRSLPSDDDEDWGPDDLSELETIERELEAEMTAAAKALLERGSSGEEATTKNANEDACDESPVVGMPAAKKSTTAHAAGLRPTVRGAAGPAATSKGAKPQGSGTGSGSRSAGPAGGGGANKRRNGGNSK